jgi:hypothetical protein
MLKKSGEEFLLLLQIEFGIEVSVALLTSDLIS